MKAKNKKFDTANKLREMLRDLIPGYYLATKPEYNLISVTTQCPREYMGRFDAGKVHWTIDLRENATWSRVRQVRVKVDGEKVTFDSERVLKHLEELVAIVAKSMKDRQTRKEAAAMLPVLPHSMEVEPHLNGMYKVSYIFNNMSLADVKRLVVVIKQFEKGIK